MILLATLFAIIALIYGSVGFGGGSSYIALLAISNIPYQLIPIIALTCNLAVTAGGTLRFAKERHIKPAQIFPLIIISAPLAFLGGSLRISETLFIGALAWTLLIASAATWKGREAQERPPSKRKPWLLAPISGAVGFLAGLVGIGGGIFLSPLLHMMRWASAQAIAGTAALFIFVNSFAGLAGQIGKWEGALESSTLLSFLPLLAAVIIGGQVGAHFGASRLSGGFVRKLTASLVFLVALRLLWRWIDLVTHDLSF